eukprot:4487415-Pyramimonas_sp.AAC.1
MRVICLGLPKGSAELLCGDGGLEDFNSFLGILRIETGGFGLNDAPRLFGLRRDEVLLSVGFLATRADSRQWLRNVGQVLARAVSAHLDR